MLPIREYAEDKYIFMATSEGTVKKTPLTDFSRPRTAGIIAVDLRDGDKPVSYTHLDVYKRQNQHRLVPSDSSVWVAVNRG